MFEWVLLKNLAETIATICRLIVSSGLNYKVAFTLWFCRSFGLSGALICLNEALLLRYITKVVLKRIIIMNDALIGIWIQLSNIFIAIVLTSIQTQGLGFRKNLQHLTNEQLPEEGLKIASHTSLFILHLILAMVIVLHVCVNKFKARNTTPVIQINIPNPANNQPSIAINNQPYNNDLFDFSSYLFLALFNAFVFIPFFVILFSIDLQTVLAEYFEVSVKDFFSIFSLTRNFIHAFILGFLSPLILMILSSELRPFLVSCISCSTCNNNAIIEVYT